MRHRLAFIKATQVIRKALGSLPADALQVSRPKIRRFFIVGCNSSSGTSAIQILRYMFPEAYICGTTYGDNKKELLQDTLRMLEIGASYVIDGLDPLSLPYLRKMGEEPLEFALVFPHPTECDTEVLECIGNPRQFSAEDLDADVSTLIKDASAVDSLREMLRKGKYQVAFPAKVVGAGLQSIAEVLKDVPQESEKAKQVVQI
jgi:hypothetical protein